MFLQGELSFVVKLDTTFPIIQPGQLTRSVLLSLILTYFACLAVLQEGNKILDYDVILSTPEKRLDELVHLAELCIEVHQQNEEYHAEVTRNSFSAKVTFFF